MTNVTKFYTSDRSSTDHSHFTICCRFFRAEISSTPDLYDLYDLAHVAGWEPYVLHGLGQDLYSTDITQHLITAGQNLIDLSDLSVDDISVRRL